MVSHDRAYINGFPEFGFDDGVDRCVNINDTAPSVTKKLAKLPMTAAPKPKFQYSNCMYTAASYLVGFLAEIEDDQIDFDDLDDQSDFEDTDNQFRFGYLFDREIFKNWECIKRTLIKNVLRRKTLQLAISCGKTK